MRKDSLYNHLPDRLIGLLITGLLLLPLMIYPLRQMIFLSQSCEIRKLESNSGKLEKLIFTSDAFSQLIFERGRREFLYRGNMYDVHSITRAGDQVVVLALRDTRESRLLLAFQNQEKTDGSAVQVVTKVGFMPYFRMDPFMPDFQIATIYQVTYQNINLIYSDPCSRICSPPPELLTSL
ncbi:MAG: hypothetical protein D4R64_00590 [Porphyromonadaceae bacterium]|nr:MAG: hypothetical protein D4R64_00590 [Porphyromonadaceae bacterium]